ncbi:hypothetical protein V8C40DRAFT_256359 [Trichoderma camerunense]
MPRARDSFANIDACASVYILPVVHFFRAAAPTARAWTPEKSPLPTNLMMWLHSMVSTRQLDLTGHRLESSKNKRIDCKAFPWMSMAKRY